jgi:hypothetical protein
MSNGMHFINGTEAVSKNEDLSGQYSTIDLNQSASYIDLNNNSDAMNGKSKYTSFFDEDNNKRPTGNDQATMPQPTKPFMTLELVKKWSKSTFKCTKQLLTERLGKANRTVDADLEAKIESLRETKRKYEQILDISQKMTHHFFQLFNSQKQLGELFHDLSHKNLDLQNEFTVNSEVQKSLFRNGEILLSEYKSHGVQVVSQ